jgi:DNA invertase Pin-like site-specific DNA recombinase
MLKDAQRRRFDVVMAWAIDRLGRSLIDLLGTIQTLEACGVDLYLDQQSIDTTTPAGRLMFQVTGDAFAEFERSMIRQRIRAGLRRAKEAGKRLGRPADTIRAGKTNPEPTAGRQRHVGDCQTSLPFAPEIPAS